MGEDGGWGGGGGGGDKKPSNKLRQSDYITCMVFEPLCIVWLLGVV